MNREPAAWMYSLIIEGEEVKADCSRANWNPKYQPFGRAGIDYAEGGIVIKTPLYAAQAQRDKAREDALERAAKVCDEQYHRTYMREYRDCAAAIRAMKVQK